MDILTICYTYAVSDVVKYEEKKTMDITERIYEEREFGATYSELSKKYGISVTACRKRYEARKKKYELQKSDIFLALQAVNRDEGRNVRVANMLKRSGVYTVEQFVALTEADCRKFRDCGDLAVQLIHLAQSYIKTQNEVWEEIE